VVGHSCGYGFYWEDGQSMFDLGVGIATDIDEAGTAIVGASWSSVANPSGGGPALLWLRNGAGWTRTELPSDGRTARANSIASDATGNPVVIAGQFKEPVNRKTTVIRPTLWLPSGAQWFLQPLPLPAGISSSTSVRVLDVNGAGQAAGGTPAVPMLWEPGAGGAYTVTVLAGSGELNAISPAGDMVVGQSGGVAAYWSRAGGVWSGPHPLTACGQSWANAVTADGLIAGKGCNGATVWRVGETVTELRLPGLGNHEASQEVWGASTTRLVGSALSSAVHWDNVF